MVHRDSECLFCKIIDQKIPSKKVFESDTVYAFHDINPQAKTHVLVIPKIHVRDVVETSKDDPGIFSDLFVAATGIARELQLDKSGFRTVFNTGQDGCQTVFHMHLHLLGGEQLGGSMVGKKS